MRVSTTLLYSSQGVRENSSLAKVCRKCSLISSRKESRSKPDLVVNSCFFERVGGALGPVFLPACLAVALEASGFFLAVLFPVFLLDELVFLALFIILRVSEHIVCIDNLLEKFLLYRAISNNL